MICLGHVQPPIDTPVSVESHVTGAQASVSVDSHVTGVGRSGAKSGTEAAR